MNVLIIGGGNLGVSIAKGLSQFSTGTEITVTRRNLELIKHLIESGITVSNDNVAHLNKSNLIILTVKPYQVDKVLEEILPYMDHSIIASAVSGLTLEQLEQKTFSKHPVVRIMPSIAAQYGESATCISFENKNKDAGEKVSTLFNTLGTVIRIDEKLMDAATVLGSCGTAYALRYIRASMQAGIEIGFDAETALAIASQTVKGAAKLALEEQVHPEQLIDRVTTPQGCTIVGINEMEHQGFSSALIRGIKTSLLKIKEI